MDKLNFNDLKAVMDAANVPPKERAIVFSSKDDFVNRMKAAEQGWKNSNWMERIGRIAGRIKQPYYTGRIWYGHVDGLKWVKQEYAKRSTN